MFTVEELVKPDYVEGEIKWLRDHAGLPGDVVRSYAPAFTPLGRAALDMAGATPDSRDGQTLLLSLEKYRSLFNPESYRV